MEKEKGLSIIIITYNRCDDLLLSMEKLKKLKSKYNYEIVIVDQASTDKTNQMFSNASSPFRYELLDKNYGVSGGRNRGAKLARYENLIFIDDDAEFIDDNYLDTIYDIMASSEYNIFAFRILNNSDGYYNWPYLEKTKKISNSTFECKTFIGCGHAIKWDFFEKVDGYSDELFFWGEETELVLKSISYNKKAVLYCGNITIKHRVDGDGRKAYDEKRFYYQVRNRFYLNYLYVPNCFIFYKLKYKIGYFIKSLKYKWYSTYKQGIKDFKGMRSQKSRLNFKEFNYYKKISKKN